MEASARYNPVIKVASDPTDLANKGLELFIAESKKAIMAKDLFCVAISGGQTPTQLFKLLGESAEAKALEWDKIHLFWVDERYVPSDSKWSNYKLALDTFLLKVDIPGENIHRIPTEESDFQTAARSYEHTIREVFNLKKAEIPVFDLIILGMGAEGHTGSLFPNSYAAFDTNDLACVVYVMDGTLNRITLTHPVLSAAAHLVVLVSGEEKAHILKEVFTCDLDEVKYPIHVLWPVLDKVTWLVDCDAAKLL